VVIELSLLLHQRNGTTYHSQSNHLQILKFSKPTSRLTYLNILQPVYFLTLILPLYTP
jgi:hypothetical protein